MFQGNAAVAVGSLTKVKSVNLPKRQPRPCRVQPAAFGAGNWLRSPHSPGEWAQFRRQSRPAVVGSRGSGGVAVERCPRA